MGLEMKWRVILQVNIYRNKRYIYNFYIILYILYDIIIIFIVMIDFFFNIYFRFILLSLNLYLI